MAVFWLYWGMFGKRKAKRKVEPFEPNVDFVSRILPYREWTVSVLWATAALIGLMLARFFAVTTDLVEIILAAMMYVVLAVLMHLSPIDIKGSLSDGRHGLLHDVVGMVTGLLLCLLL